MIFSILPKSEYGGVVTADIFRNLNYYHREALKGLSTITYSIEGDDRPEQIAYLVYGDPSLYWVIFLLNQDLDPYYDWLLPAETVSSNTIRKYSLVGGADAIDHWVDDKSRWWYDMIEDPENPRSWYNKFDFENNKPEEGQEDYRQLLYVGTMIPVSRHEHEFNLNERNRTVELLNSEDMSIYVNRFLKLSGVT